MWADFPLPLSCALVVWGKGEKDKLQVAHLKGHVGYCLRATTLIRDLSTRERWLWTKHLLAVKENVRWTQEMPPLFLVCGQQRQMGPKELLGRL